MSEALGLDALTTSFIARNTSSTCNSCGSAIWASAKNIKPLVDANCHAEAIEDAYHQSPIRFSPIHYRNHGSKSPLSSGQTILFGCPLELCIGGPTKIPPVLKFLLNSVHDWPVSYFGPYRNVGQQHILYRTMEKSWPLANKLEKAWTGVEGRDRALIFKRRDSPRHLIMVCLLLSTI